MGFSVSCSLGNSHVTSMIHQQNGLKLQALSSRQRGRNNIDFNNFDFNSKFLKHRIHRNPYQHMTVLCRHQDSDFEERNSPNEVRKEIQKCYALIHSLGRGVVYLGSSRMGSDHAHYLQVLELGREVAKLLNCTSWSGAGPGLMDAATKGALEAGKRVGGFKIGKEAGEWTTSNFHPYLPPDSYLTSRFFSARKHGLVDAVVRNSDSDRTAVVALPGGIGTLDEIFEILALIQLERIGSALPVPFILMNYNSFYSKLLDFLDDCEFWGTVSKGEVASLWKVCENNSEALAYLSEFYNLPSPDKSYLQGGASSVHETVS